MNTNIQQWKSLQLALGVAVLIALAAPGKLQAQVPPAVEDQLAKMGHIVEPGCTAKLYRTLFGKNDYNMYWPVDAAEPNKTIKLFPGITVTRDLSYGPQPKDLLDIFVPDKGAANRTVLIFVPGGASNKIEQQSVEANMFYDNIGKWAADNGMVGVTMQRGGSAGGLNVSLLIDWLQKNVAKYKGNPSDMFIMAHSAGTVPLAQYIGNPFQYGLGVKGAIFMGSNPNIGAGGGGRGGNGGGGGGAAAGGGGRGAGAPGGAAPAAGGAAAGGRGAAAAAGGGGGGRGGGAPGGATGAVGTSGCINTAGAGSGAGVIRGPSSSLPDNGAGAAAQRAALAGTAPVRWDGKQWVSTGTVTAPPAAAGGARGGGGGAGAAAGGAGGGGGGRGGAAAPAAAGAAPAAPAFTNQDGFRSTRAAIAIAWGEWDIMADAEKGMPASAVAIHDELCKLEGPKAKDGVGHCPTMMWFKGESHMSEVFSFGSIDKTVSEPVLAFIKQNH